jgi:hypothetical protein
MGERRQTRPLRPAAGQDDSTRPADTRASRDRGNAQSDRDLAESLGAEHEASVNQVRDEPVQSSRYDDRHRSARAGDQRRGNDGSAAAAGPDDAA